MNTELCQEVLLQVSVHELHIDMLKNDEINFVENTFLLIDYGEDICSPV